MNEPLPTPEEMAAWDKAAIEEFGLRPELLMENAGAEALRVLREISGDLCGARVLLVAGGGNNGGDAFALARRLLDEGATPLVLHVKPRAGYSREARYHMDLARRAGVMLRRTPLDRAPRALAEVDQPDILVDGLFGTGGDLVQQRFPDVGARAVDERDLGAFGLAEGFAEFDGEFETACASADDQDAGLVAGLRHGGTFLVQAWRSGPPRGVEQARQPSCAGDPRG